MSESTPFSPRAVLAMLAVGAGAFLLFLYTIGAGWGGRESATGSGHAASNGLNGYSALVQLLERRGDKVSTSRNRGRLDEEALLIVTPPHDADIEALSELLRNRRSQGPTLVILPKWFAFDVSSVQGIEDARPGWVQLGDAASAKWLPELDGLAAPELHLSKSSSWHGLGLEGRLPTAQAQTLAGAQLAALVSDQTGAALASFVDDGGYYPTLLARIGRTVAEDAPPRWALTIVAEPDLLNNQGLADPQRARLAIDLVHAAGEEQDLPIVFDLTVAGLGGSDNLLTLAFEPPFLAATLCLLLAALLVAWRAFRRFGPPVPEAPSLAMGKRQLARNGAGLIERARRLHLLGPPYASLLGARIAALLGIREPHLQARDEASAKALAARGIAADYPTLLEALRSARRAADLLRAAQALKTIERTLAA